MSKTPIVMRYDLRMAAEKTDTAEIMVYGEICQSKWDECDMTAKDFDTMLKDAAKNGATNLKIRINSPGGDVFQAVAMKTMLDNSPFEKIDISIEGLCASAATLICCARNAHVTISEGSEYMIHNPSTFCWGTAKDFMAVADRLTAHEKTVAEMYSRRCGKDEEECRAMMDAETWMTAKEAVENGFCDEMQGTEAIAACVTPDMMSAMKGIYLHTPEMIGTQNVRTADSETPAASENKKMEEKEMELKDVTMEQLRAENPQLVTDAMTAGALAERERIADIDDLTPIGYEAMAAEAKKNGTPAMEYHKMIVKAQREKGAAFMAERKAETQQAETIKGGAADEPDMTAENEMRAFAEEMKGYAQNKRDAADSMY